MRSKGPKMDLESSVDGEWPASAVDLSRKN